jgi:hypothetical protein
VADASWLGPVQFAVAGRGFWAADALAALVVRFCDKEQFIRCESRGRAEPALWETKLAPSHSEGEHGEQVFERMWDQILWLFNSLSLRKGVADRVDAFFAF